MSSKKRITVFTPTYNRALLLPRLYVSLLEQNSDQFIWLVIDDGSTDDTKRIVQEWINQNEIEIRYVYKDNGGMHTAHNLAYEIMETELNVCIDSDDKLAENAIHEILECWDNIDDDNICGIVGLDTDLDGKMIGTRLPENLEYATLSSLYSFHNVKGDKKLVYLTKIMKEVDEYPEFYGERLVPLGYKYLLADQSYKLKLLNKELCNVEYQRNGSSDTVINQYFQSPKGFNEYRKLVMSIHPSIKKRITSILHYDATTMILKDYSLIYKTPRPLQSVLLFPVGVVLYIYYLLRRSK